MINETYRAQHSQGLYRITASQELITSKQECLKCFKGHLQFIGVTMFVWSNSYVMYAI